jgi:nucleotide-binding universal stress UspA family protein
LEYGRQFARTFGASLHVIHVADHATSIALAEADQRSYLNLLESVERSARRQLEAAVTEEDRRELRARPILLTETTAAAGIVAYAKEQQVDLIVLGTHGRRGWSHVMMGSVAEKVVRTAPCPVLTVRHPEHEFIVPDAIQIAQQVKR